jgi:hypothetical protein
VASYVHWEDTPVTISADQALGAAQSTGSRTMKDEAADFLRDTLGRDEVPAEDVQQAARKAGIASKPLRVAREALKVRSRREGFGPGAVWKWSLPGGSIDALAPIDAHPRDKASMDPEGIYGSKEAPPCDNTVTAGDGHRDADVTAADKGSLNPEVRDPRDCGPTPESLIRRPVCAVCKKSEPPPNQVGVDGLTVWLHPGGCEDEYQRRLDAKSHQGNGKPAEKKPWSTPTVEEVPWDTLPTEMRMLVLGLPNTGLPPQVVAKPNTVADVPDRAEAPPAQPDQRVGVPDVSGSDAQPAPVEARPATNGASALLDAGGRPTDDPEPGYCTESARPVPAQPTTPQLMLASDRPTQAAQTATPPRSMLPGDRRREEIRARNAEAVARLDAQLKGGTR